MIQQSFVFDLNKCTGCQACQVACVLENQLQRPIKWRQVYTFNEHHVPGIPVFHLSLACHHCIDPPCMKHCPTLAYSKDPVTGAVTINSQRCIGCKYCSWVCPYDAPQFNKFTGLIEKCTFCEHRDTGKPACVIACPTAALEVDDFSNGTNRIPGFYQGKIKPALRLIPLRENQKAPEWTIYPGTDSMLEYGNIINTTIPARITLVTEWPLVVFTFITTILFGYLMSSVTTGTKANPLWIPGAALMSLALTTIHLGKKFRSYRSVVNWRNSWLSREIIFYLIFVATGIFYVFFGSSHHFTGWSAAAAGFLTLVAMDKVYQITNPDRIKQVPGANALLTGIYFWGLFVGNSYIYGGVFIIKLFLYLYRKFHDKKNNQASFLIAGVFRVMSGFLIPIILWSVNSFQLDHYTLSFIIIGELIDRCEFYLELDMPTPRKQMMDDFKKYLTNAKKVPL